jgi:hypothetical protein
LNDIKSLREANLNYKLTNEYFADKNAINQPILLIKILANVDEAQLLHYLLLALDFFTVFN